MRKTASRPNTVYTFVQRTDIFLTRSTGDVLVSLLRGREWLESQLKLQTFRQSALDYSAVALAAFVFGSILAFAVYKLS
jgi:hypothetical protein